MIAGVSSVALVVRLKSIDAARAPRPARWRTSTTCFEQRKVHQRLAAEERDVHAAPLAGFAQSSKSTAARAVSKSMNFGLPSGVATLSSPYS